MTKFAKVHRFIAADEWRLTVINTEMVESISPADDDKFYIWTVSGDCFTIHSSDLLRLGIDVAAQLHVAYSNKKPERP